MMAIADWLRSVGLPQYVVNFVENDITISVLGALSDQDLKDIGVSSLGHRRLILLSIAKLDRQLVDAPGQEKPAVASAHADGDAIASPSSTRIAEAERRQLTVMFCDLVGSTALAARLDPEDMRAIVRAYQSACAQVIGKYEGFVAQYLGDGVMAYFGYPQAHEDDAERAVRAGLDLIAAVATLGTQTKIEVRIGIATGLVVVGDLIGEGAAKERAVTGETPNLAARLQGLASPGSIVVSAATRRLLGGMFDLRELGPQAVKGLDAPVAVYAVEGARTFESRFEARAGGLTGFVGREDESRHLLERKKIAWRGRGQVVLVSGEAGIGKSRLTARLVEMVASEPHIRMRYQCTPHHRGSALHPAIAQLERAAGIVAGDAGETKLAKLEAVLAMAGLDAVANTPLFAALLSIPTADRYAPLTLSASQLRQRTLSAMLDQVEGLAKRKPLLMIYEDAHWADATSLDQLDMLAERIARLPVLAIVTGRPEFAPAWAGRHNVSTVSLRKLDGRDVRTLVESVTGGAALPADVLDQIVAKSDGVPLFVEEMTKTVIESGASAQEDRRDGAGGSLPVFAIPATLQDSLMARLDRSNPVKEIAQIAAAIGREFSYDLLLAVAGRDEGSVCTALAGLEELELATRRGVPPQATYTFKHALVQDAAYESLLKSRRQAIHRRIAKALRDRFPDIAETEPEILAHHFTQARRIDQAVEWWTKAGDLAFSRWAFVEATSNFETAIALAEVFADDRAKRPLRLRLHVSYANTLSGHRGAGAHETTAAFERAAEIADPADDASERYAAQYGVWIGYFARGEATKASVIAENLLRSAESDGGGAVSICWAYRIAGASDWSTGNCAIATARLEYVLAHYDEEANYQFRFGDDAKAAGLRFMASCRWMLGDVERARSLADQVFEYALRLGHVFALVNTYLFLSVLEAMRGDVKRTTERAKALLAVSREHDMPSWIAQASIFLGWTSWRTGEHAAGENAIREGRAFFTSGGRGIFADPLYAALWAEVQTDKSPEAALSILDDQLAATATSGLQWFDAELHRRRAGIALRLSSPARDVAEADLIRALKVSRAQKTRTFELRASLDLARLYCGTGREREARALLGPALVGFTETPELPEIEQAARLLAELGGAG